jgi:hypothetical protein
MVAYWQENLDLAREQQAGPELVAAIEACLAGVAPPEADAGGPLDMVAADEYRRLRIAHERAEARVDELSRLAAWQEARLRDMSESLSWRLTAVLRRARSGLRRSAARSGGGR